MSEAEGTGTRVDPYGVATGVVGGSTLVFLQVWVWSLVAGAVRVPAGTEPPVAEMGVFLALGVAVPAGGVALLAGDGRETGVAAGTTVVVGIPIARRAFETPPWLVPGLVLAVFVLAVVTVVERTTAGEDRPHD
jgi:hypothetical protein